MSLTPQLLVLPLVETVVVGVLAGVIGALAVLDRRVFFTESVTHATFPGAVAGVVAASGLGGVLTGGEVGYGTLSLAVPVGTIVMCLPMIWLMRRLGRLPGISSQAAAGVILAVGFALGSLLSTWFAPLPLKVDGFLTGSILNVNRTDVGLTVAVLVITLLTVAVGGRRLAMYCFDSVGYRAAGLSARMAEWTVLILICLAIGVLVPAVGTILPIALIAAPAAAACPWVRTVNGLLLGAGAMGAGCCLLGFCVALALELSVGGTIALVCALAYTVSAGFSLRCRARRAGRP
ncbi:MULTISPECIES: metal ABC transporter permease [unclassified Actinomyces]|uniref:metal ABC transporter permease n=1 Tax=unclassified Actinomyces TaxID=2609248 RepID=UPI000D5A231A|nr:MULTISPECIES: metal ABC transporter permease [unclassified Actinomyces]RAX20553.1 metal ABC transporter permease [Actinomyces sp. Z3]